MNVIILKIEKTEYFCSLKKSPGAEIGRQACLRGMCSLGRAGSSPAPGTTKANLIITGKVS